MKLIFKMTAISLITFISVLGALGNQVNAESNIANGSYQVPFKVIKDNSDEKSMTNDYMQSPAQVTVTNGQAEVEIVLNNSSWWQSFKVDSGNGYSDVQVISDTSETRIVKFSVNDITSLVNAKIHVIVPDINYDNKYDIRIDFDTSNMGAVSKSAEKEDSASKEGKKETVEKNPQTSDANPLILFSVIAFISGMVLMTQHFIKKRA